MPETFSALAVLAVALLPGALYTWAFERQAGRWGIGLSDRVLRFIGGSALFHAAFAPLTYWLWSEQWPRLRDGQTVGLALWLVPVAYVALPALAGTAVGVATRRGAPWAQWFTGPDPAPRAWDYLFQYEADGWVRLRMKSGTWVGGAYAFANGRRSYTAGYPDPQDLYLAAAVRVDPDTGEFMIGDGGLVEVLPGGLLVRWEEVEYLEFIDA
jgi:hypothetical protein